jgi:hypothetical protein
MHSLIQIYYCLLHEVHSRPSFLVLLHYLVDWIMGLERCLILLSLSFGVISYILVKLNLFTLFVLRRSSLHHEI